MTKNFPRRKFYPINVLTQRISSDTRNFPAKVTKFPQFPRALTKIHMNALFNVLIFANSPGLFANINSDKEIDFEINLDVEAPKSEPVNNSVEISDDRNAPNVSDATTTKLL